MGQNDPPGTCPTYHWPGNVRELRNILEREASLLGITRSQLYAKLRRHGLD